ncbi:hypothetical protein LT85_3188 [Collimonas arenae]|uniref:Uncharacterized protein n=1 Tax=Collimonas arenae TaxID=279058 RepID=A0A0A1FCX7_9BURK|nr:hypothetical protein LT85_3188 [Collimonas arenae]
MMQVVFSQQLVLRESCPAMMAGQLYPSSAEMAALPQL